MSEAEKKEVTTNGLPVNPSFPVWFQVVLCMAVGGCLVAPFLWSSSAWEALIFLWSCAFLLGLVLYVGGIRAVYVYWWCDNTGAWSMRRSLSLALLKGLVLKIPVQGWFAHGIEVIYCGTTGLKVRQGDRPGWVRASDGEHTNDPARVRQLVPDDAARRFFGEWFNQGFRYRARCGGREVVVRAPNSCIYTFRDPDHLLVFLQACRRYSEVEASWWSRFTKVQAFSAWLNEDPRGLTLGTSKIPPLCVDALMEEFQAMAELARGKGYVEGNRPSRMLELSMARASTLETCLLAVYDYLVKTPRLVGPQDGKRLRALLELMFREVFGIGWQPSSAGMISNEQASALLGTTLDHQCLCALMGRIAACPAPLKWEGGTLVMPSTAAEQGEKPAPAVLGE